ncbi:MAG: bile acid-coenzyme ligase [Frankiaceae bacterium]|nr:bile acid-coenzyme ligase [Frankiaceae bacterium]
MLPDGTEERSTWRDVDRRSEQIARTLAARGVGNGDRVALELVNSTELVLLVFAAWKIGAVPVPARWDLPAWERDRLLDVVAGRLSVRPDDLAELMADAAAQPAGPLPDVIGMQTNGICSSGSTGAPKVIITDRPTVWVPSMSEPFGANWMPIERPQRMLGLAPLYHTNGFSCFTMMLGGDEIVLLQKFDAELVVDLIERHRITTFTATPTMLQRIVRLPGIDKRDLSSIRFILQGAAVLPPTVAQAWFDLIGPERVVMAYGMSEQLGLTCLRGDEWLAHPGSVGRGFRDTEVRIIGPDGAALGPGEIGEIYLRAPHTGSYSYLGEAPLLPRTEDGFASAGDLGHVDEDGYLYIADRRVDLILSGGANVYPAEVESALADHPAIADVVVIGLPDPEWGQRVHAVIAPMNAEAPPTAEDVIGYAKQRLAAYKVPKTVELVAEIPRTAATKVSRSALVADRLS